MSGNYILLCFFGISCSFFAVTVCREAIVGGIPVVDYYYHAKLRYQVSVQIHGYGHICGGGIISDYHVLTAAHCVLNQSRYLNSTRMSILAGTVKLNGPRTVGVRVQTVFYPREFHPTIEFYVGDIAILKLVDSLNLEHRTNLKKLKLPRDYNINGFLYFPGFGWQSFDISGYGHTSGYLHYFTGDILSDLECETHYPDKAIQSDTHICVEANLGSTVHHEIILRSPCIGDDGGPIVDSERNVIGILSRIPRDCDERHEPAVYTRVTHYLRMILNVMEHDRDPDMISLHT